jgi:hypothetical protein
MQRSRSELNMSRLNPNTYCGSYADDDSGIGYDYSSSSDLNFSTRTSIVPSSPIQSNFMPFPISGATGRKRINAKPLIKFPWDGAVERIRPATLKNSENSDFIICRTHRGTYIAYRTPIVPAWVTRLVNEIEWQQR